MCVFSGRPESFIVVSGAALAYETKKRDRKSLPVGQLWTKDFFTADHFSSGGSGTDRLTIGRHTTRELNERNFHFLIAQESRYVNVCTIMVNFDSIPKLN